MCDGPGARCRSFTFRRSPGHGEGWVRSGVTGQELSVGHQDASPTRKGQGWQKRKQESGVQGGATQLAGKVGPRLCSGLLVKCRRSLKFP